MILEKHTLLSSLIASVLGFVLTMTFQNCSNVEFSTVQKAATDVETSGSKNLLISDPKVIINNGENFTASANVQVAASATNATEVYLTQDQNCEVDGKWTPISSSHTQQLVNLNTEVHIYAKFRNSEGIESECVSDAIVHDSIPPTVAIDGTVDADAISSESNFEFLFQIVENGSGLASIDCSLQGAILTCPTADGVNLTAIPPGNQNLTVNVTDRAGNHGTAELPWRVVAALGAAAIQINNGALYTDETSVDLQLIAENATSMRISDDALCESGDIQPFQPQKDHTLSQPNSDNTVYAQFYNDAGDETSCLSASILHDNLPPQLTVTGAPNANEIITDNLSFEALATDSGTGIKSLQCFLNGSSISCENGNQTVAALNEEGDYTLTVVAKDKVDNTTQFEVSFEFLQSLGNLGLLIDGGAEYSNNPAGAVDLQLQATNAKEMYITNTPGCGSGGQWENYQTSRAWILASLNSGATSVYVKYRNSENMVSQCLSDSIIHDSLPYEIEFVNAPVVVKPDESTSLEYIVKDQGVEILPADVADLKGCEIVKEDADPTPHSCSEVGVIPLENLSEGTYTVYVTLEDHAKNQTRAGHQFVVQDDILKCDDPLLANFDYFGECLALVDIFDREEVTQEGQFNWTTMIDDVARTDHQNVQANIFSHGEYGFGEAAAGDQAVYVTGRLGGSVHDVYLISVPLDLSQFDQLKIDFNYLPIHLESFSWRGETGPEHIRLDICTSSLENCGVGSPIDTDALKGNHWISLYTQEGFDQGQLTDAERGLNNTGRNHTQSDWLLGSGTIDLNSSMIVDKSKVVFRITIKLDEGFINEIGDAPDPESDLIDGIGIDNVRAIAIQNQPDTETPLADL